jgi:molybdate-binding protein/DNA-binding XRE family transcriptional regulator
MEVKTNLAGLRTRRGMSAAQLAAMTGISRQTVYAIEAGTYVPNTAVSLKLARVLDTSVEEIFSLEADENAAEEIAEALVLDSCGGIEPGQPLQLCKVGHKVVAVAPEDSGRGLPQADAVLLEFRRKGKLAHAARLRMLATAWKDTPRILLAGCDPSVSFLAHALQARNCELVVAYENSTRALQMLQEGLVHVAGTHLIDQATGKTDLAAITRGFPRGSVAVFSYALWEEGILTARGNPKGIEGVADLVRKDVRFTNREAGAGCRRLLDDLLKREGIEARRIRGYEDFTVGHLPAARLVRSGRADCCISTRSVARALSLGFVPLAKKPYHLVIRRNHLNLPPIQILLETLERASFRREVEACTGYGMQTAGDRLL